MNSDYQTVAEFITEFRTRVGDSTCSIPERYIISWLNNALRRLARSKGLDKLFKYQDTFRLVSMNSDGSAASAWVLEGVPADKDAQAPRLGMIIDIKSLLVLDASDCGMFDADLCYVPYNWFRKLHPFPESEKPGDPCSFTLNQIGGKTKIIFDCPIDHPYAVDMVYTAFHPRLTSVNDIIRIPYAYSDILQEFVHILYNEESADFATARALYEDLDFLLSEARELLAKQPEGLPLRSIRASF